jgi:hypothetical protein
MPCPTFVRTQFLGAGIVRYDARLGWGGQGGTGGRSELEAEVVEDKNCGGGVSYSNNGWGSASTAGTDAFDPPEIGKPVEFNFNTFRFGGILTDWYEQDSAGGAKTYVARITDPTEILVGTQLLLKGYTGETFDMPGLYNIYGWLEENFGAYCPNWSSTFGPPAGFNVLLRYTPALGYGGANDRGGLPWSDIYTALYYMTSGLVSRFGGLLKYRDMEYYLDMSELPPLDPEIKFTEDYMSLYDLITRVCELAQYDFYVELATEDTIAIRTSKRDLGSPDGGASNVDTATGSEINSRLSQGVIGSSVASAKASGEATATQRGLELRNATVNSFLTGDYRRDMWQVSFAGGCSPAATIWPYWGKDSNGALVIGYDCTVPDFSTDHYFWADISNLGLPGLTTWRVNVTQMRAALASETAWRNYVLSVDNTLANSINMMADGVIPTGGFLASALRVGSVKALDVSCAELQQMGLAEDMKWYQPIRQLYEMVKNYANSFMGKQFMVRLPYICKKIYAAEPFKYYTNWKEAASAWVDTNDMSGGYVLGMHVNSVPMTLFKDSEGLVQGILRFESSGAPLAMHAVPEGSYIQPNPYLAFVRCRVKEIVHNVGGNPTDSRAIVEADGEVCLHQNAHPAYEPLLLLYAINKHAGVGLSGPELFRIAHNATMDKWYFGMPPQPLLPVSAAVPLQSTVNCYGPWGAKIGDNSGLEPVTVGKTAYARDTSYSPWQFGSLIRMNYAGDVRTATMLSDRYVTERGSVTIADAPSVSLGEELYASGPEVSNVRVNFAGGTGAVTTQYQMQLYTAKYGRLGTYWVDAIKRAGQDAMKYRRFYNERALERYLGWMSAARQQWGIAYQSTMKRFQAQSSHDMMIAEHLPDPESGQWARTAMGFGELTQLAPAFMARSGEWYHKAGMETAGMFRPFSTQDTNWMANFENAGTPAWDDDYLLNNTMFYSKEQVPPIFCEEHHMPITMETLNPFLNAGESVNEGKMTYGSSEGHDIEYIVRDGVYPAHMSVRQAGYSEEQWYRGVALKGPLVLAGWGFDIDNKPVPNASPGYPGNAQMYFEDNWLRKPWKWKCGPVDLRWDDRRKVWTAPTPMKIVRVKLCGPLLPGDCAHGLMYMEELQTEKDGNFLPWQDCCPGLSGNAKITITSNSHRPVPEGFDITAYYDTYLEMYHMLHHDDPLYIVQVLTTMNPGSLGLGRIVGILGSYADQCGTIIGSIVGLDNPMNHPLCAGAYAFTYLRIIIPLSYETWCDRNCPSEGFQWHCILQASYKPIGVVTCVDLLECSDYHTEDITCKLVPDPAPSYDHSKCYCYYTIDCDQIIDDWVEYDIKVKDRQIYLDAAFSTEATWTGPCVSNNVPGGPVEGGSKKSDLCGGPGGTRRLDC